MSPWQSKPRLAVVAWSVRPSTLQVTATDYYDALRAWYSYAVDFFLAIGIASRVLHVYCVALVVVSLATRSRSTIKMSSTSFS